MTDVATPARRMRFAVLLDVESLEQWQHEALRRLCAVPETEFAFAIVREGGAAAPARQPKPAWKRLGRHTLYNLVYRRVARKCAALGRLPLRTAFPGVRVVPSGTERLPRGRTALPAETLALCEREGIDMLVRFGFGILSGAVLTQPRLGVWSFHHGDPAEFRGMPPGVWEIIRRAPTTGAIVQRLSETLDGGQVLAMARLPTRAGSYTRQLSDLLMGSAPLLAQAAQRCRRDSAPPAIEHGTLGPIYRKPTTLDTLRLLLRMPAARLAGLASALFRHQHWRVAAVRRPIAEILAGGLDQRLPDDGPELRLLAEEPGMFAADPFVAPADGGGWRLLVERFDWVAGKGHIALADMDAEARFSALNTCLETPGHLSYPFVQQTAEGPAILPEATEGGVLRAYPLGAHAVDPAQATRLGAAVLDPTIVEHRGRYWMFYGGDADNTTLHLRHADRPEGPWTEAAGNPVKIDVANARPAGAMFRVGDMLIRPAQICTPHYGRGLVLNRVDALDEHGYAETAVARILPPLRGRYRDGVHTIAIAGDWLVFDQARRVWKWRETLRVLRAKLSGYL